MRAKPRISKVELPAFGFQSATVRDGFVSREAAGAWLATQGNVGSGSQLIERASALRSPHADMNVPKVYR